MRFVLLYVLSSAVNIQVLCYNTDGCMSKPHNLFTLNLRFQTCKQMLDLCARCQHLIKNIEP